MSTIAGTGLSLETLVDRMFDQVLEAAERAELIAWIREWEAAHPEVDNAHRITGWIDVAYAFQARTVDRHPISDAQGDACLTPGAGVVLA